MSSRPKDSDLYLNEDKENVVLSKLDKIFKNTNIFSSLKRELFFNDEPRFYDFCTLYKSFDCNSKEQLATAGGIDLNKKKAILKSLGEAVERHCLSIQKKEIYCSYKKIKSKAIDIFKFNDFKNKDVLNRDFNYLVYNENDKFYWCRGYNLYNLEEKFIPSQLVSVPYKNLGEKTIRESISTGAALSTSLGGSIYRGICEIVERDAFMIAYLTKTKKALVDIKKSGGQLKEIFDISKRYKLEPIIIDITNDLQIPAMMGILIDGTGLGPAISVGLSADLDPQTAAIKAIKEAFHSRPWTRKLMIQNIKNNDVNTFEGRALYWSKIEMIDKLDFLIKGKKYPLKNINQNSMPVKDKIIKIQSLLKNQKLSTFFIDLTTPEVKKHGFYVTKTIIPELVPLYLDEKFKYLQPERLNKTNLNDIPHPFL